MTGLSPPPVSQSTITTAITTAQTAIETAVSTAHSTTDGKIDSIPQAQKYAYKSKLPINYQKPNYTQQVYFTAFEDTDVEVAELYIYQANTPADAKDMWVKITADGVEYLEAVSLSNDATKWLVRQSWNASETAGALDSTSTPTMLDNFLPLKAQALKIEVMVETAPSADQVVTTAIRYYKLEAT